MTTLGTEKVACGDGGAMDLHVWEPDRPPKAAMLLLQEIFGVGPYIRAVGERLADAGYLVGAPDVFWRFHRNWESGHDEAGLQASFEKVAKLDFPQAFADCTAALDHLGRHPGLERAPGVIGFCLGGVLATGVAARGEPTVCVSYYGGAVPLMIGMLDDVHCPTLFHFGNRDQYIANELVDQLSGAIAGRERFVLNVEDAGHAFDNHESEMFHDAAAARAAWAKTAAFLAAHNPA